MTRADIWNKLAPVRSPRERGKNRWKNEQEMKKKNRDEPSGPMRKGRPDRSDPEANRRGGGCERGGRSQNKKHTKTPTGCTGTDMDLQGSWSCKGGAKSPISTAGHKNKNMRSRHPVGQNQPDGDI